MALSALNLGLNWSWYESAEEADGGCAARPTSVEQAEEILSESGTTQTRRVAVRFSATDGVVTSGTAETPRPGAGGDSGRAVRSAAGVGVVGMFPMESVRAFECNSARTVFRLHFHRSTSTAEGFVHGMDVETVLFRTDQAEGMRQAMHAAWKVLLRSSFS